MRELKVLNFTSPLQIIKQLLTVQDFSSRDLSLFKPQAKNKSKLKLFVNNNGRQE